MLEAQLALKRGQIAEAIEHFDAALKKDPDNKIVQYWKAQLDGQTGAVAEATRSLEAIVRDKPVKEVDPGTTLMSAAQSALASLSLHTGAFDDAIRRFEELKRSDQNGTLSQGRPLAIDHGLCRPGPVALGQARNRRDSERYQEPADRRRAGPRRQLLPAARRRCPALAQLDYVLEVNPTIPGRRHPSYILLKAKQHDQAAHDPAQGDRAVEAEKGKAAGGLLPDAGGRREREAPGRDAPWTGPSRCSTRASSRRPSDLELSRPSTLRSRPPARRGGDRVRGGQGQGVSQGPDAAASWSRSTANRNAYDQADGLLRELLKEIARRHQPRRGLDPDHLAPGGRGRACAISPTASASSTTRPRHDP